MLTHKGRVQLHLNSYRIRLGKIYYACGKLWPRLCNDSSKRYVTKRANNRKSQLTQLWQDVSISVCMYVNAFEKPWLSTNEERIDQPVRYMALNGYVCISCGVGGRTTWPVCPTSWRISLEQIANNAKTLICSCRNGKLW